MTDEQQVEGVDVTDDGDPATGIVVSQSIPNWFRPVVILGVVITALLAMISLTVAVVFLAPTIDRLSQRAADERTDRRESAAAAREDRRVLIEQIDELRASQETEQQIEDCVILYYDDIELAKGVSQLAFGDNLVIFVTQDLTPEQRTAQAQQVLDADAELSEAMNALEEYRAIDPPPTECPHPRAED